MTLPLGMILFGSLLVYAGWTGKSVRDLLAGGSIAPPPAKGKTSRPSTPAASAGGLLA